VTNVFDTRKGCSGDQFEQCIFFMGAYQDSCMSKIMVILKLLWLFINITRDNVV
jgi:hypothetical protein